MLGKKDVDDLLRATKILGTGGGGEMKWARPLVEEVYAKQKQFKLLDPKDVPDEEIVIIVGAVGGGVSEEIKKRLVDLPRIKERPELIAKKVLTEHIKKEPYAYLASELGAGNTIIPMYVAAMTDSFTVDADCCGRAKPEISISTTNVQGLPVTPLAIVSPFGDLMILKEAIDDSRAEDICRYMAMVSGGICSVARCPTKGKDLREAVVPRSISEAIGIGKHIREAAEKGESPTEALIKASNGYELFHGKVKRFERKEEGAFVRGNIKITGIENYKQHELNIWFKNEFLISWKDETPFVTCPDSLYVVDAYSGEGLSCWGEDFQKKREVMVIGRKAHELWRTEKGLQLFSPRHFGFKIEYTPIERIARKV